jgi:hypothetical protein
MTFDKDVSRIPQSVVLVPPSGGATVTATPVRIGSTQTRFEAVFAATPFPAVETGFTAGPYGRVVDSSGQFAVGQFDINDSVAPVVLSARYGMSSTADAGVYHDTLVVTYSELVAVTGVNPFQISGHITSLPIVSYGVSGSTVTALVDITDAQRNQVPQPGDSLSIAVISSTTTDSRTNTQTVSSNRRVPIVVTSPPDFFNAASGPVPFNPPNQYYTIVLQPNERVATLSSSDHAKLRIYDATGGTVLEAAFEQVNGQMLQYRWDGRNADGRLVGQGTYVVIVELTMSGQSSSKKYKVGVKR